MVIVKAKTQNILLMQDLFDLHYSTRESRQCREDSKQRDLVPEEETRDLISSKIWSDAPRALL